MVDALDTIARGPFGLDPVALPTRVQHADGALGERSAEFDLRVDRGNGPIERLHVARVTGEQRCISSLMILGLPRPQSGDPVFFFEAFAVLGRFHSVALDLLPCGADRDIAAPRLEAASRVMRAATERPRSLGLHGTDTSDAVLCVSGSETTAMFLPDVFHAYLTAWVGALSDGKPQGEASVQEALVQDDRALAQRRLLQQLGRRKGAHPVLASMFGSAFMDTAWHGVFFAQYPPVVG